MKNKLQELTEKLYNEGLTKGKTEAEQILSNAKAEARQIIEEAKTQAESIVSEANKSAREAKKNADLEIAMTSRQIITLVKRSVEDLISAKAVNPTINAAMDDVPFVQSIIKTAIEVFKAEKNQSSLNILLPESKQQEFDKFINDVTIRQLNGGNLEFKFSKNINSGFRIGVKEQGYYISFTNQDFDNLFKEYMRPKMQKLLFDKE